MSAAKVLGGVFVVLLILELIGLEILRRMGSEATLAAERSPAVAVLGMAWIFGVWAALVALMVFLIAWVAEGMSENGHERNAYAASSTAGQPAVTEAPGQSMMPRAS